MTEEPLIVNARKLENIAVIDLTANFYTSTKMAQDFKKLLSNLLDEKIYFLVINMKNVESIDSEGLGALSSGYKMCKHNDGALVICDLENKDVADVLEIVNLDKIIPIFKTEKDALNALKKEMV